jgi:2'-5' RNA ligase
MRFWVGIVIPPKRYSKIRGIQEKLSKKYDTFRCIDSRIGPHITLTHQPEVGYEDIRKMEEEVLEISRGIKPFNVRISGVEKFNGNRVIYAKVLKDAGIILLNKKLSSKLRKYGKVKHRQFTPHATLAFFENSSKNFRKASKELKNKRLSFSFKLEALSIAKAKANGRLKVYKAFNCSSYENNPVKLREGHLLNTKKDI